MFKSRKLRAVVRHEFFTIIKQPSFWIALIALPLVMGIIILISVLTENSDKADINDAKKLDITVVDNSGLIDKDIARQYSVDFKSTESNEDLVSAVKSGSIDGLIVYPDTLSKTGTYQMFADNTDKDHAKVVNELGRLLLQQSLLTPIRPEQLATLALSGGQGEMHTYTKGHPARTIPEYIVPGAFLVLFYIVLVFSVSYALTSVSEEKENRSIEMVLSYIKPRTLIFGKLLAIILVTLTQIAFIGSVAAIAYVVVRSLGNDLSLPFKMSDLTFVPSEIAIGAGFLVVGFVFYVALMAMIGAIFPSSKEASGFSTFFFILPAVPFWGYDAIVNQSTGLFTQVLSYFPLTSPTTVLLRNAAGNLSTAEGLVSLSILIIATALTVILAARAFRLGTLEYSDRIKFRSLLGK